MNRELRQVVISAVMVVTFAATFLIAQPFLQRWAQAKVQEIARAEKPSGIGPKVMTQAVIPQVLLVFGCLGVAAIVGVIVGKKIPRAEQPTKRRRQK